ncbi:MAG: hypothetical protein SPF22_07625 [Candidatus Onthovivens sp.]|nr:hypothetical protein [Candidatus Onthovivens sp.]
MIKVTKMIFKESDEVKGKNNLCLVEDFYTDYRGLDFYSGIRKICVDDANYQMNTIYRSVRENYSSEAYGENWFAFFSDTPDKNLEYFFKKLCQEHIVINKNITLLAKFSISIKEREEVLSRGNYIIKYSFDLA